MKITFNHEFFDKLALSENHLYLKHLRNELCVDRKTLANALGIAVPTIRKYESDWAGSGHPPKWYAILLRLLCGDLSHFGTQWHNCRIHKADKKLASPYFKHTRMTPMDMNSQYSAIARQYERQIKDLTHDLTETSRKYQSLLTDYKLLQTKLLAIEKERERIIAHDDAVRSGKVVNIGIYKRSV